MDLLQSFKDFIAANHLFSTSDQLLLAVSGGLDSVVLCELCHQAGYYFAIAHCNFQLRGAESDRDEAFVTRLAAGYGKELFLRKFDTQAYANDKKASIQVAARELRYDWFRGIMADRKLSFLLTAHHLDDNVETLLMNFFKGTGIAGLRAIMPKQNALVRPLLFAGKEALRAFALDRKLDWVEDSSNTSDKYARNVVRREIIPHIERLYPGAIDNLAGNITRFREIESLYRQSIERHTSKLIERRGDDLHIPALKLKKSHPLNSIVYELIHPFGFSPGQVGEVVSLLDSGSGKYILSSTHRILKNRNWLIISPHRSSADVDSATPEYILIESAGEKIVFPNGTLHLTQFTPPPNSQTPGLEPSPQAAPKRSPVGTQPIALLDASSIQYPLLLRKWKQGDYFYPLGMRKKKKLGRFFIDNKLSLAEKERTWVIEMDKKIIWVVGLRIDERFRIGPGAREILKIELRMA